MTLTNPTAKKKSFSILLNVNLSSVQKISKIIKQSAKLVINLWPEQKSLLDAKPEMLLQTSDQKSLFQDQQQDQTLDSLEQEDNPGEKEQSQQQNKEQPEQNSK